MTASTRSGCEVPEGLQITLSEFSVPRGRELGSNNDGTVEQIFVFASNGVSFLEPTDPAGDPDWRTGALLGFTVFPNTSSRSGTCFAMGALRSSV